LQLHYLMFETVDLLDTVFFFLFQVRKLLNDVRRLLILSDART